MHVYTVEYKLCPIKGMDRPLGLQEVERPRISRQSAHEGVKVVSPTHHPLLPLTRIVECTFSNEFLCTFFLRFDEHPL